VSCPAGKSSSIEGAYSDTTCVLCPAG
jgi:hypothetical protein